MMILSNELLAIFNKINENLEGADRINTAMVVRELIKKKGIIYKFFKQWISEEELNDAVNFEVNNYDEAMVLNNILPEDREWMEEKGYKFDLNPGVRFSIKNEDNKKGEIALITVEQYFILNALVDYGIENLTIEIFESAMILLYMPDVCINILRTFEIDESTFNIESFIKELNKSEKDAMTDISKRVDAVKELIEKNEVGQEESLEKEQSANIQNSKSKAVDKTIDTTFIPKKLEDSLQEFNYEKSIRINARAKEIDAVFNVLMKSKDNNVVLVGEEKIGKSAIVEKVAYLIHSGKCPDQFNGYRVVKWDLNSIFISADSESGRTFAYMEKWLKQQKNIILVIDEMPTILESSKMLSISIILKYAMKIFLEDGNNRIIAIASKEEHALYFEYTNSMPKTFESITVKEPENEEMIPMIREQVEYLQGIHNTKISEENIKYIITIATTMFENERNPGKTLKIIEKSLITAKNEGRDCVERDDILKNCNINYDSWKNLTEENIYSTAFHEAGHYLVHRKCNYVTEMEGVVVSILPMSHFRGVTVYDWTDKCPEATEDWVIEHIAVDLAGRVAEKLYTQTISAGARQDLENATIMVERMILEFGMTNIAPNMVIDYFMCDDRMKRKIYKKSKKIIKKGYKLAEIILKENVDILIRIVDALTDRQILNKTELDEIVNHCENLNLKTEIKY